MNRSSKQTSKHENLKRILEELADPEVYSSVSIAFLARDRGLLDPSFSESRALHRLRITLNRLTDIHAFPVGGDCLIVDEGKAPIPGWFGWRWKRLIGG